MTSKTVTAIRVQKRNPRRANLFVDGEFVLGLSIEVVQDFGLHRGMELTDDELAAIRKAEQQRQAYQDALRLINYRPRSVAEMRRRLGDKGYDEAQVEATVKKLQELGLLDDTAFARGWVENRQAFRPRGRSALVSELRQKGVSSDVIDGALDELLTEDEDAQALAMARERAPSLAGLERDVFFRRLQGYLARRGFSPGAVIQAVRKVWEETAGGQEGEE